MNPQEVCQQCPCYGLPCPRTVAIAGGCPLLFKAIKYYRSVLQLDPAWRIRASYVDDLEEFAHVAWAGGTWQARIEVQRGLNSLLVEYAIVHELLELALAEHGEFCEELLETYVQDDRQQQTLRHRTQNIRDRVIEKLVPIVLGTEKANQVWQDTA